MLRPPSQTFDGSDNFAGLRIDRADALATPVNCEYSFCLAVVKNRVRVLADRYFVDHSEGFQIEDRYRTRICGTNEAAPQIPDNRNAVDVATGDFPNDRRGVEIEHDHFPVMGNIQTAAFRVGCQIIPSVIARDRDSLDQMAPARR